MCPVLFTEGDVQLVPLDSLVSGELCVKSPGLAVCGLQPKSSPPSVCVDKVLLKHRHIHAFT